MHLSPREKDKLLVAMAADVARRRLGRGVRLNYPEAVALITDFIVEGARDVEPAALLEAVLGLMGGVPERIDYRQAGPTAGPLLVVAIAPHDERDVVAHLAALAALPQVASVHTAERGQS